MSEPTDYLHIPEAAVSFTISIRREWAEALASEKPALEHVLADILAVLARELEGRMTQWPGVDLVPGIWVIGKETCRVHGMVNIAKAAALPDFAHALFHISNLIGWNAVIALDAVIEAQQPETIN